MKNNIFQKARIKLTLYYIAIMAVILLLFSSALIFTIESKIRHGFKDRVITIVEGENDPTKSTIDEIEFIIYSIDGLLLIIIGFSSYFLANETLKPIKAALELQKNFSADASHDLRTPLAIMTTESEVILKNRDASAIELREAIVSNLEEIKKMSKLVNDLLIISRGDNKAVLYSFVEVDIHDFINKLINKLKYQSDSKGLNIRLGEYKKVITNIDKDNFERAITNIIQNAIKYTKHGDVIIDIREDSKKILITTSDTGVGISQKDLPHIFDRFYKADHSRNDNSSSGLGLPIAKLIIEEHKGNIRINSEVNRGTVVTIQIPK